MKNSKTGTQKIEVHFFQRKPRPNFNFSLEAIFEDIRCRLKNSIEASTIISPYFNDGVLSKVKNIIAAGKNESHNVNHITGEVHYLNFLMDKEKTILTVLDCGMVHRKKGLSQTLNSWLYLKVPVKKAKKVTAISEQTKNEIVEITNCDPNKVKVIPVAVSDDFKFSEKVFNFQRPEILQIGTGYNKNIIRLAKALEGINCHLTIIGKLSETQISTLKAHSIEYTNEFNISNSRMLEKYRNCDILTFVSTFEGFGMPIVEANKTGRVVVTSNLSSMPEIAGDAACLVNPYDSASIRQGVLKVINDAEYRKKLITNGMKNAQRFDPDTIAQQYYDLYKSLA